ncbi:MAG TPA: hypothetical protein DCQ31_01540 [Bacteroidales bacterium]|nr:hypothetical protein [Bacteroidales bacterium]
MNKFQKLFIPVVLLILMVSPACMMFNYCISGSGRIITEERDLRSFEGISLNCSADVYFVQSDEYLVEVEAYENIQPLVDLDVENGVLEIDIDGCILSGSDVRIFISAPDISLIENSGSGSIYVDDVFNVSALEMKNHGSGDIHIKDMLADYIEADITGSGDIFVAGSNKCFEQNILITGSGSYEAIKLESDAVQIRNSGSGDCVIWAREYLSGRLSGSGDVIYKGNPQITVNVTGSGRVKAY